MSQRTTHAAVRWPRADALPSQAGGARGEQRGERPPVPSGHCPPAPARRRQTAAQRSGRSGTSGQRQTTAAPSDRPTTAAAQRTRRTREYRRNVTQTRLCNVIQTFRATFQTHRNITQTRPDSDKIMPRPATVESQSLHGNITKIRRPTSVTSYKPFGYITDPPHITLTRHSNTTGPSR